MLKLTWKHASGPAAVAMLTLLSAVSAVAQSFPSKPIKMVIPFVATGHLDASGRLFAEKLSQRLGQPVVVENRPGASGTIGSGAVARAPADGYTILFCPNGLAITDTLFKNVTFRLNSDLVPISTLTRYPYVIVSSKDFPAKNFVELIAHARKTPGLTFATTGIGSPNHLTMEIINLKTGANLNHIPYVNQAAALTDVISGRIHLLMVPYVNVAQYVTSGDLKALAVTARERIAVLPETQSFKEIPELGGFDVNGWTALWAPAKMPANVVAAYGKAVADVMTDPEFTDKISAMNLNLVALTGEVARRAVEAEIRMWKGIIEEAKIPSQ